METKDFKTHIVRPKVDRATQGLRPPIIPTSKIKEESEIEAAREREGQLGRKPNRKLDELSEKLGQTSYVAKPRLEWLTKRYSFGQIVPLTVSRYYPHLKLLIDISINEPADTEENIDLKGKIAQANGHLYFNLKTQDDIFKMFISLPGAP